MVNQAIILAAGKGTRLKPLFIDSPKALIEIKGKPIIQRSIEKLVSQGVTDIIIVTGHGSEKFDHEKLAIGTTSYKVIFCPFYSITNNIVSLWMAKKYLNKTSIIMYGDVIYSDGILKKAIQCNETSVLVDMSRSGVEDYCVAIYDDNTVAGMGKNLKDFDGEYIGITKVIEHDVKLLQLEIENMLFYQQFDMWWEDVMLQMAYNSNTFKLKACDITNLGFWSEIDNINDIIKVNKSSYK